jgi:hypothetical protein
MKNSKYLLFIFIALSSILLSCGAKQENAGKERLLLGKWKSGAVEFEFKKDGQLNFNDGALKSNLEYFITNERNIQILNIINMGDTARAFIDSLSPKFLRLRPERKPEDAKDFIKQ